MREGPNDMRDPVGADAGSVRDKTSVPRPPWGTPEAPFDRVSDASIDSFPASDAPPWTGMRLGPPQ